MTKGVPIYNPKKIYICKVCGDECDFGNLCQRCKSRIRRAKLKINKIK